MHVILLESYPIEFKKVNKNNQIFSLEFYHLALNSDDNNSFLESRYLQIFSVL